MCLPTKCNGQSFTVCVCEFGANDSIAWPLCGGNQEPGGETEGGGGMARKVARPRGGLAGEGERQEL